MIHLFQFFLHGCDVLQRHILHHDHGESTHPEVIHHDVLALHRIQ